MLFVLTISQENKGEHSKNDVNEAKILQMPSGPTPSHALARPFLLPASANSSSMCCNSPPQTDWLSVHHVHRKHDRSTLARSSVRRRSLRYGRRPARSGGWTGAGPDRAGPDRTGLAMSDSRRTTNHAARTPMTCDGSVGRRRNPSRISSDDRARPLLACRSAGRPAGRPAGSLYTAAGSPACLPAVSLCVCSMMSGAGHAAGTVFAEPDGR